MVTLRTGSGGWNGGGGSGAGGATAPPASPVYTGYTPGAGYTSPDYTGSYQEWFFNTFRGMAENYARGIGQTSGLLDPSLGAPNEADFGSWANGNTGTISQQTYNFFKNYIEKFGTQDPWIAEHFGAPPTRSATFQQDPNSAGAVNAAGNASRERIAELEAASRRYETDTTAAVEREKIGLGYAQLGQDWKKALMDDATRRYIAEGDWGTQKYVAELREKGETDRLQQELGFRREELAQRATEERARHHESMVALTLEVAKYDAELGAQPRNWLKYAAWLQNRGQVVNGLNLAMAASVVPENAVSGAETAGVQGGAAAGAQTILAQQTQNASGGQYNVNLHGTGGTLDLNSTDYAGMANQLLGVNGMQQFTPPTPADLQAASATLQTSDAAPVSATAGSAYGGALGTPVGANGNAASFGAYGGPTTNSLGMTVQPSGHKENYRKYSRLLPSQQQMRAGEIESIGRFEPDFQKELQMSRPKGGASGAAAWG